MNTLISLFNSSSVEFLTDELIKSSGKEIKNHHVFQLDEKEGLLDRFDPDGIMGGQMSTKENGGYSCTCGGLAGEINEGMTCPECQTKVSLLDKDPYLYISLPEGMSYLGINEELVASFIGLKKDEIHEFLGGKVGIYKNFNNKEKIFEYELKPLRQFIPDPAEEKKADEIAREKYMKNEYFAGAGATEKLLDSLDWEEIISRLRRSAVSEKMKYDRALEQDKDSVKNEEIGKVIKSSSLSYALKKEKILEMAIYMKNSGMNPSNLILHKIPVIPPSWRPVNDSQSFNRFGDINLAISRLMREIENFNEMKKSGVLTRNGRYGTALFLEAEKKIQYQIDKYFNFAGKAKENVREKDAFDFISNKHGFKERILGVRIVFSSNSQVTANPDLELDELSVSMDKAFEVQELHVVYYLCDKWGFSASQALNEIYKKSDKAIDALLKVNDIYPVNVFRHPAQGQGNGLMMKLKIHKGDHAGIRSEVFASLHLGDHDGDLAILTGRPESAKEAAIQFERSKPTALYFSQETGKASFDVNKQGVMGLADLTDDSRLFVLGDDYRLVGEKKRIGESKTLVFAKDGDFKEVELPAGSELKIKKGDVVKKGEVFAYPPKIDIEKLEAVFTEKGDDAFRHIVKDLKWSDVPVSFEAEGQKIETTVGRLILWREVNAKGYEFSDFSPFNRPLDNKVISGIVSDYLKRTDSEQAFKFAGFLQQVGARSIVRTMTSRDFRPVVEPSEEKKRELASSSVLYGTVEDDKSYKELLEQVKVKLAEDPDNFVNFCLNKGVAGKEYQLVQMFLSSHDLRDIAGENHAPGYISVAKGYPLMSQAQSYPMGVQGAAKGFVEIVGHIRNIVVPLMRNVNIEKEDCGTPLVENVSYKETYGYLNKVLGEDIYDKSGKLVLAKGVVLKEAEKQKLLALGDGNGVFVMKDGKLTKGLSVPVRSVSTCLCHNGVCAKCYGADVQKDSHEGELLDVGTAIGVIGSSALVSQQQQAVLKAVKKKVVPMDRNGEFRNMDFTEKFKSIMEGSIKTCELASSGNFAGSLKQFCAELDDFYNKAGISVDSRYSELLGRSMIVGKALNGPYIGRTLTYPELVKLDAIMKKTGEHLQAECRFLGSKNLHYNPSFQNNFFNLAEAGKQDIMDFLLAFKSNDFIVDDKPLRLLKEKTVKALTVKRKRNELSQDLENFTDIAVGNKDR